VETLEANAVGEDQLASVIEQNMGLVVSLAKSFRPRTEDELEEFVQLGRIGLWKAYKKHDPSRAAFSTNAWHHVRWEIMRHLSKKKPLLQLDDSVQFEDNRSTESLWEYLPDTLTDRERQVIQLRLDGHTFIDIGKQMGYSRGWANITYRTALKKITDASKPKKKKDSVS
jgi:RNA polymerase sigma factor (sigma-70 family)